MLNLLTGNVFLVAQAKGIMNTHMQSYQRCRMLLLLFRNMSEVNAGSGQKQIQGITMSALLNLERWCVLNDSVKFFTAFYWMIEKLSTMLCCISIKCFHSLWTGCKDYFFFPHSLVAWLCSSRLFFEGSGLRCGIEVISQRVGFYDLPKGFEQPVLNFNKRWWSDSCGSFGRVSHNF